MLARLRRLLAERSRRGRAASAVLAVIALAGGVIGLVLLFPERESPRIAVSLATADPTVRYPAPLRVWPNGRIVVAGQHLTGGGTARVALAGRSLGSFTTSPEGNLRGLVAVPGDVPPGAWTLTVEDAGTGRVARADVEVLDPRQPAVVVQPAEAPPGDTVVVSAGGLPPLADVEVVLDPETAGTMLRSGRTTRDGLLVLLVILPLAQGEHTVGVVDAAGRALAPPAAVRIAE